ncbi:hypothetical protein J1N35_025502 [Gossypium stocksii]|uniref:DUF4283 domain-containing protein n=1 Tax=Gossypium stocksii TaxID=47602 RepID=A0A9D3ZXW6_9ROSI|nr:hypothetical protein J1N35_025502 [Gossypium stocksii]
MDLERVQNGVPWTFNNHLLIFQWMDKGKDPPKVLLIYTWFWVQVHDVPPSFYFEGIAWQLRDFIGKFLEYGTKSLERGLQSDMRVRVEINVRQPLK